MYLCRNIFSLYTRCRYIPFKKYCGFISAINEHIGQEGMQKAGNTFWKYKYVPFAGLYLYSVVVKEHRTVITVLVDGKPSFNIVTVLLLVTHYLEYH
jgi:hypothetical protein